MQREAACHGRRHGNVLPEKYGEGGGIPELDNETAPERIREIHREYIRAGADILRTNTFASNTGTLGGGPKEEDREQLLKRVYENVQAAVGSPGMPSGRRPAAGLSLSRGTSAPSRRADIRRMRAGSRRSQKSTGPLPGRTWMQACR